MSPLPSVALAVGALMLAPLPDPAGFSPGIGYTVSRLKHEADAPPLAPGAASGTTAQAAGTTTSARLAPHLPPPPPGDLARVQGSPRAQGMLTVAAIAAQVAMFVAGVAVAQQQRAQLLREQEGQVPPYRPYR